MNRYDIKHVTITALGVVMGAMLALVIAPGNTLALIALGIVFGYCARALCGQDFGGDWFGLWGPPAHKKAAAAKPSKGHC